MIFLLIVGGICFGLILHHCQPPREGRTLDLLSESGICIDPELRERLLPVTDFLIDLRDRARLLMLFQGIKPQTVIDLLIQRRPLPSGFSIKITIRSRRAPVITISTPSLRQSLVEMDRELGKLMEYGWDGIERR